MIDSCTIVGLLCSQPRAVRAWRECARAHGRAACWQSRQRVLANTAGHCADRTPHPHQLNCARARAQPRLAGGPGRPQKRAAAPQKRPRGGGRGRGRSLLGPGGGERGGALGKRRRGEYDLHEMVAPAAGGGGGPRFVERVQVCPDRAWIGLCPLAPPRQQYALLTVKAFAGIRGCPWR